MHKNIKKIITGIAVIAIMATMITPIGVSARTYNAGTLFWDFESSDDVAYEVASDNYASVIDVDNSGAWGREWPAKDGSTSWGFRVMHAKYAESYTVADSSVLIAANDKGGTYCLKLHGGANNNYAATSLGAAILLSEKELVPNREYTIEFDVLGTSDWKESAYVAFSKPSARKLSGTEANNRERIPWLKEGMGTYTCATTNANVGPINKQWETQSVTVTAPANLYDDGFIRLHISIANLNDGQRAAQGYLDNIKITPTESVTSKTSYAKLRYGKSWDFEDDHSNPYVKDSGIPGNPGGGQTADLFRQMFTQGHWASITPAGSNPWFSGPRIRSIEDAVLYINGQSDASKNGTDAGHNGVPAPGSNYCARVLVHTNGNTWNVGTIGARVRITKDEFPAGTYTFNCYAGFTHAQGKGYKLNLGVYSGEKEFVFNGNSSSDFSNVTESFSNPAISAIELGRLGQNWNRYTTTLELTDDCFDENGVATVVLHTNIMQQDPRIMLYLDDISLYSEERTIAAGDKVNFFVTTVSDAPISNILSLAATKEGYALKDCDVSETSVSAIDTKNYTVQIPSGVTNPEFKLYMWNKTTLEPLALPMD